jgi:iron complex outermembrane recepter protein
MRKQIVKHKLGRYFETGLVGSAGAVAAVLCCTAVLAQSSADNPAAVQNPSAAPASGSSEAPPTSTQKPPETSGGQPDRSTQGAPPSTPGPASGQLPAVDIHPAQQKAVTQQTRSQSIPTRQAGPSVTVRAPRPVSAPSSAHATRSSARRSSSRVNAAPAVESPSGVPNPPLNATGDGSVGYVASRTTVGTKTNTPIIEIPQSISVITQSELATQNPQTVKDALLYTAGVAADQRTSLGGYDIVYSRGFVVDRFWDEMKVLGGSTGYITPQVDPYALQRIEVLRGPSSVLYGYNSPGGILNLVSKVPTFTPYREMEFVTGSYDRKQGGFDFSGALDRDQKVALRLIGLARDLDNQVDFTKTERYLFAPSLTWKPTDRTTLTILTYLQQDPHVGLYNFVPAAGSVLSNVNGKIPVNFYAGDPNFNTLNREQGGTGYLFEHQFSDDLIIRQKVRFLHTEGTMRQVLPLALQSNQAILNRYTQYDRENINAVTNDNQVLARFFTGIVQQTLIVGYDYQRLSEDNRLGQANSTPINIFAPVYYQNITAPAITNATDQLLNQSGAYAQDQIKIDRFILTLSGRRDWVDTNTFNVLNNSSIYQKDQANTSRIGGTYVFDYGIAPYASYANSFQPVTGTDIDSKPFKPTTGTQQEVGLKFQPPTWNLLFTFAAYDLVQQNVLTSNPVNPVFSVQTGEIQSRGIEFETKASLANGLDAIGTYTSQSVKITQSNTNNLGKRPLNVPNHMASGWLFYTVPWGTLSGLGFGGGVRYMGDTYGDQPNTLKVPAYTLVDLALKYDLGAVRPELKGVLLTANIYNLLDKTYVSECSNITTCLYGQRRTFLSKLAYQW